jgi:hypothetical protein
MWSVGMKEKTLRKERQERYEAKGLSIAKTLGWQWRIDVKGPSMARAFDGKGLRCCANAPSMQRIQRQRP